MSFLKELSGMVVFVFIGKNVLNTSHGQSGEGRVASTHFLYRWHCHITSPHITQLITNRMENIS